MVFTMIQEGYWDIFPSRDDLLWVELSVVVCGWLLLWVCPTRAEVQVKKIPRLGLSGGLGVSVLLFSFPFPFPCFLFPFLLGMDDDDNYCTGLYCTVLSRSVVTGHQTSESPPCR